MSITAECSSSILPVVRYQLRYNDPILVINKNEIYIVSILLFISCIFMQQLVSENRTLSNGSSFTDIAPSLCLGLFDLDFLSRLLDLRLIKTETRRCVRTKRTTKTNLICWQWCDIICQTNRHTTFYLCCVSDGGCWFVFDLLISSAFCCSVWTF